MISYRYNLGLAFEEVVRAHSEKVALKFCDGGTVLYGDLNRRANRIAHYLRGEGIGAGDVVCISGTKEAATYACLIACLKIGAPYTILDPASPLERLRKVFSVSTPMALCVDPQLEADLAGELDSRVCLRWGDPGLNDRISACEDKNLAETEQITGTDPAYVMFTSGSTGVPKGAVMTHDNVLNMVSWSIHQYGFGPDEVLTNVNPLFFDNSVFDVYSSLFTGASLAVFQKDVVKVPRLLLSKLDELGCTSWFSVPSLLIYLDTMKALEESSLPTVRRVIFGGEGYPKAKLRNLYDRYSDRIRFYNVYGPTECTCICSSYEVTAVDFEDETGFPPLGKMAPNFSYLILDEDGRVIPEGETGELYLSGPNVGIGYFGDPDRTQAGFLQNPLQNRYREIVYRTGDLVRLDPNDGKLYIAGRLDNQIKHMGYRIELEEIETAFARLDYVSQAAVFHEEFRGLSQIVAVASVDRDVDEQTIRTDVRQIIPEYMVPTRVVIIDELPKNANGKVDRRRIAKVHLH